MLRREETTQQTNSRPAILVVEDDPVFSGVLQRLLRRLTDSNDIVYVLDSSEALAHLDERRVPLVITDYNLLDSMNGLKLSAAIKSKSPSTRIVLITGYATPALEQEAYANGVDFYLPKPFLLNDLVTIVRKILDAS